jgi:hypothetical protein
MRSMNKVILQFWEESERGWGTRPDGCSLHLDINSRNSYVEKIYEDRKSSDVPDEYDRIVGEPIDAFISDVMFARVKLKTNVRIHEHELNNLMNMAEIIVKDDK